jgi:hypothetical protein
MMRSWRGDFDPMVRVPWNQDFVLGTGNEGMKLFYEDLNIYE